MTGRMEQREGQWWCHCGATEGRSDHCECCGCEHHERTCEHRCTHTEEEGHEG
jgi:hypothetical protein